MLEGKITCGFNGFFADEQGRSVQLKGINLDGGSKFPKKPYFPSHRPLTEGGGDIFYDGDHVSFVGRPFPIDEVPQHIRRIKGMGYNSIRYILTWEAIEHEGPGIYDEDFIQYTVDVLRIIDSIGGIYVYLDPHQDVWSRFSGGDGAPMWTLYAAGFDPKNFVVTEAAMIENAFPADPEAYPKMLWTTNYKRLAAGTMFTLFFAGATLAPKCIINGVNIQHFLQKHFIDSFAHLVKRIKALAPFLLEKTVIGIETMNEPNSGFLATENITEIPSDQPLRLGTCPTILEAVKLGMGIATEVSEYKISVTGPKKIGTTIVDPKGVKAWLDTDRYDTHYSFKRDPGWKLGECIWAQHGVWDIESEEPLIPDYFEYDSESNVKIDEEYFINNFFVDHYAKFRKSIRSIQHDFILFLQPPPLQAPPLLKGTDLIDEHTAFCPHYYDGMSLMFKTWNRKYNVDTLGIVRGRYLNPVFGIVFGEGAIRRSFKRQLLEMKLESQDNLGKDVPVIFSEIGMPFDMDDKRAFEEDNFESQTSALDALAFALESSNLSHSWWCYTSDNCHKWGDRFNCEDFSFWSRDDDFSDDLNCDSFASSTVTKTFESTFKPRDATKISLPGSSKLVSDSSATLIESGRIEEKDSMVFTYNGKEYTESNTKPSHDGIRAIDAVLRPYCLALNGEFIDSHFDVSKIAYTLKISGHKHSSHPTKIYLPHWHFDHDDIKIEVDSGIFEIDKDSEVLEWHHESGEGTIVITNVSAQSKSESWWPFISNCLSCF